jgi:hypothetical protein
MCAASAWLEDFDSICNPLSEGSLSAVADAVAQVLHEYMQHSFVSELTLATTSEAPSPPHAEPVVLLRWASLRGFLTALARCIVAFAILGRGGVSSFSTAKLSAALMALVVCYLAEIGALSLLLRRLLSPEHPLRKALEEREHDSLARVTQRLLQAGSAIASRTGLLYNFYSLVMSLALSLLPSWTPRAEEEELVAGAAAAGNAAPVRQGQEMQI